MKKIVESKNKVQDIQQLEVLLKIDKVSYRYHDADKEEYAIKNISYEFEKGKIYAIKGAEREWHSASHQET